MSQKGRQRVLITGANGFIGRNLHLALSRRAEVEVMCVDRSEGESALEAALCRADTVYHLAGVNRPEDSDDFEKVNVGLTQKVVDVLRSVGTRSRVVLASSKHAAGDTLYGESKRAAEEIVRDYASRTGAEVHIYRLPGVFGKWARPHYNSVVATFCYQIARQMPITIDDPVREIELVYIDDVISEFLSILNREPQAATFSGGGPSSFIISLGQLAEILNEFREGRHTLATPDLNDPMMRKLLATYTSYIPIDSLSYTLDARNDSRGVLYEILKSPHAGQVFVSRTKPGITRGGHYHDTKIEKFCVISGTALIRLRHAYETPVTEYRVNGSEPTVVDIPPGYTHSIENIGAEELIVLFWASEVFDAGKPDTHSLGV